MKIIRMVIFFMVLNFLRPYANLPVNIKCEYQRFSDSEGMKKCKEPFKMEFLVDTATQKAYLIGNNGSAEVTLVPNKQDKTFSFIEITPSGNVMLTSFDNKLKSVHSRHTVMMGQLVESQYYGRCKVF